MLAYQSSHLTLPPESKCNSLNVTLMLIKRVKELKSFSIQHFGLIWNEMQRKLVIAVTLAALAALPPSTVSEQAQ